MAMGGQGQAPAALAPPPPTAQERNPVPTVQDHGSAPGLVWMGAKYVAPTTIRYPDRPVLGSRCTDYAIPVL